MHDHGHLEHLLMHAETLTWAIFLSITWFSFVMSWHCAAMCGPLVCTQFSRPTVGAKKILHMTLSYNLGRLLSYSGLGAVIGLVSESLQLTLNSYLPQFGIYLSVLLAFFIGLQGLLLLNGKKPGSGPAWLANIAKHSLPITKLPKSKRLQAFLLGLVTVFLPCMTLSAALAASALVANPKESSLVLLGFALGTVPVMVIMPALSSNLAGLARDGKFGGISAEKLQITAGILLISVSGITIFRAFH